MAKGKRLETDRRLLPSLTNHHRESKNAGQEGSVDEHGGGQRRLLCDAGAGGPQYHRVLHQPWKGGPREFENAQRGSTLTRSRDDRSACCRRCPDAMHSHASRLPHSPL